MHWQHRLRLGRHFDGAATSRQRNGVANLRTLDWQSLGINFVMKFTYCGEPLLITVAK